MMDDGHYSKDLISKVDIRHLWISFDLSTISNNYMCPLSASDIVMRMDNHYLWT